MRTIIWIVGFCITIIGLYFAQTAIEKKVRKANEIFQDEIFRASSDYAINQPDQTLFLSSELKEVSGLSIAKVDSVILTVQDEKGVIYHINKKDGRILAEEVFAGKGDYEGIELVDDTTYIVTSGGNIYAYSGSRETTIKYETNLQFGQDIEGLGYSAKLHALIISCKGRHSKQDKHLRNIYAFDLTKKELIPDPLFILDAKEIATKLARTKSTPYFSPSGIAIAPDGDYYILSSVAKALIIVDDSGQLKSGVNLSRALHSQPEGLFLDQENTLYISNEGRDGVAKIYIFYPKPQ